MAASIFFALLCLTSYSSGLQLKIEGQRNVRPRQELLQRGNMDGAAALSNNADVAYYTNLTLGGQLFTVQIDTGSSDLWVAGNVTESIDTGGTTGITYCRWFGPIKTSTIQLAGYTVQDQAFLQITPDSDHPIGIGIMGLGPTSASAIYYNLTAVSRIHCSGPYISTKHFDPELFDMPHGDVDPTDVFPGKISIGELLDGYSNVESEPKLEVTIVPDVDSLQQRFQFLLDEDGIIGPDGEPIYIITEVPKYVNMFLREMSKLLPSFLPNKFTTPIRSVADAIYSGISGAEYQNITGIGEIWVIPCDEEVNITFKFSGNSYHMHPLDVTMDPSLFNLPKIVNSNGQTSCLGAFQPIIFTPPAPTFDIILGMSFLRNVYTVFNYGDFIADGNGTTIRGDPYVQLLSTTDPAEAHSDFVAVRLSGLA
ncbi:aspartic peptidase domain-containing protein [Armillaria mellea]|nr:aspartic peptidase domain-containing protein [Armillaria mellea]